MADRFPEIGRLDMLQNAFHRPASTLYDGDAALEKQEQEQQQQQQQQQQQSTSTNPFAPNNGQSNSGQSNPFAPQQTGTYTQIRTTTTYSSPLSLMSATTPNQPMATGFNQPIATGWNNQQGNNQQGNQRFQSNQQNGFQQMQRNQPMQTGFQSNQQTGFQSQQPGFQNQQTNFQNQQSGFQSNQSGLQPMQTGFQQPMYTGWNQPQPTGTQALVPQETYNQWQQPVGYQTGVNAPSQAHAQTAAMSNGGFSAFDPYIPTGGNQQQYSQQNVTPSYTPSTSRPVTSSGGHQMFMGGESAEWIQNCLTSRRMDLGAPIQPPKTFAESYRIVMDQAYENVLNAIARVSANLSSSLTPEQPGRHFCLARGDDRGAERARDALPRPGRVWPRQAAERAGHPRRQPPPRRGRPSGAVHAPFCVVGKRICVQRCRQRLA
jgi:hypothetical protein